MRYRTDDGRFVYLGGTFIGAASDECAAGSFVNELNLLRDALRVAVAECEAHRNRKKTNGPFCSAECLGTCDGCLSEKAITIARAASDSNDQIRRVRGEVKDG